MFNSIYFIPTKRSSNAFSFNILEFKGKIETTRTYNAVFCNLN